jgi:DNA invertase Pin-like site-specific DNA recombinase
MKVAGYIRVSTDEQATQGVSLAMQERRVMGYCMAKDWELGEVVRDEGRSAKDLNRPGVQRLFEMVDQRAIEAIVIYKLDRLTRSVGDLNHLIGALQKRGVKLVSIDESLDPTTACGELMMNLLISVSQWERRVIGERTKAAMQHLKAQGRVIGRAGFDNPTTLARITEERAQGRSYQEIADGLTRDNVPSGRGGQWTAMTVRRMALRRVI